SLWRVLPRAARRRATLCSRLPTRRIRPARKPGYWRADRAAGRDATAAIPTRPTDAIARREPRTPRAWSTHTETRATAELRLRYRVTRGVPESAGHSRRHGVCRRFPPRCPCDRQSATVVERALPDPRVRSCLVPLAFLPWWPSSLACRALSAL